MYGPVYCIRCKQVIEEEDLFCAHCGTSQRPEVASPSDEANFLPAPPRRPYEGLVCFGGFCLAMYASLLLVLPFFGAIALLGLFIIGMSWFILTPIGLPILLFALYAGFMATFRLIQTTVLTTWRQYVVSPEGRTPIAALAGLVLLGAGVIGALWGLWDIVHSPDRVDRFDDLVLMITPLVVVGLGLFVATFPTGNRTALWHRAVAGGV